ncbi:MAG: hypothetical protein LBL26_09430, partial [Peptococcaceae bacterium]|nr:hypothetical protein [Peptococcaceae bacterium]
MTEQDDMYVQVAPGAAWINGYVYHLLGTPKYIKLDVADGVLSRIDRIVAQWNLEDREVTTKVKKGTYAVSPVAPDVVRTSSIYELSLATVLVSAGALVIQATHITDTRLDSRVCGIVSSLIQPDTSGWYDQFFAKYNEAMAGWVNTFAASQTARQDDFDAQTGANQDTFDDQSEANQALFDAFKDTWAAWFAGIQDVLDGDTAGNLLALIQALQSGKQDAGDYATSAQGTKADSAIQGVKVNGAAMTPDAGKIVDVTVPPVPAASSSTPAAPGTAAVGTSTAYAREDHAHAEQTAVSGNAGTATKLVTARTIDGVSFDGAANITHYGSCSTAAATAAKA